jgi:tRNA threonylcarbamoyladenosine biosynthesis protein TsaE
METLHISDESELMQVVLKALEYLKDKDISKSAAVLALSGELGAGKTTFVKVLAHTLGVAEVVTSPTFVIMKRYELEDKDKGEKKAEPFSHLYHIDAYRIEALEEMSVLGFESILTQPQILICIEWAERIAPLLPAHTLHLHLEAEGGEGRIATFS